MAASADMAVSEQVKPSLDALKAAGLDTAVQKVFLYVEGDPIIWGEGKHAMSFMRSTINLVESLNYSVGIATNNVQWSWITNDTLSMQDRNVVEKLSLWYDCSSSKPNFGDFLQLARCNTACGN